MRTSLPHRGRPAVRRTAATLTAALFGSLMIAAPIAQAADPAPGTFQGTITETETGAPLSGACAHVYNSQWLEVAVACADATGHYAASNLPVNTSFRVKVTASDHADRWAPAAPTVFNSYTYTVTTTGGPTVDVALPAHTGTVAGQVTAPDGRGEALDYVYARVNGITKATTRTRADGTYELPGLSPGTYDIVTGGYCLGDATAGKTVVMEGVTQTVDSHYTTRTCTPASMTFAGKVIDGWTGAAIPGAAFRIVYPQYNFEVAAGVSDGSGAYHVEGLSPATLIGYRIQASAEGYPQQWANGGMTMSAGGYFKAGVTEIPLAAAWGDLHGTITGPDGQPVAATVTVTGTDKARGTLTVVTGADGAYSFPKLAPGEWTMKIVNPTLGTQWYHQVPYAFAMPTGVGHITVTPNSVTAVDEQFAERSHVEVTLLDADNGLPITDGCVTPNGTGVTVQPICANTDGVYKFDVVPSTSSSIWASSPSAFPVSAAAAFPAGQTVRITQRLQPAGTLNVPVQHKADGTIPPACVTIVPKSRFSPGPGEISSWCNYNSGTPTDTITAGLLKPGPVQLFVTTSDTGLGAQWLGATGGTGQRELAAIIDVHRGVTTAPTIKLDPAGAVQGYVTGVVSGYGISVRAGGMEPGHSGQCVTSGYSYCTDNDSIYSLRLGPYAWPLEAYYTFNGDTWSGGAASRSGAHLVQVAAGQITHYDMTITSGGRFTVNAPATMTNWRIETYDAVTGDASGTFWQNGMSSVAGGPRLLRMVYTDSADGVQKSCWIYRKAGRGLTGVFAAGIDGGINAGIQAVTVEPGTTCLTRAPMTMPQPRIASDLELPPRRVATGMASTVSLWDAIGRTLTQSAELIASRG
jgi:hypothetical protein